MINEHNFIIKKNGEPSSICYCRHPELIENYDKAIADTTQTWEVHHRLECCFTYKFLIDMGLYYNVGPEALIFLTREEHRKIDSKCKRNGVAMKGKLINRKDLSKKILCVETGIIYNSARDAERKTGIDHGNISKVCNGRLKTACGYHWSFV